MNAQKELNIIIFRNPFSVRFLSNMSNAKLMINDITNPIVIYKMAPFKPDINFLE